MKLLYGVQATGQGHISRARAMANVFKQRDDIDVTWLFSGRSESRLFDMEPFENYIHRRGLSFTTSNGGIDHFATVLDNNFFRFVYDVYKLDVSEYDAIVTDFEPVTAWAGRRQGKPTIGIGHQYAFKGNTPCTGDSIISRAIMRWFAPVSIPLGLHWLPYNNSILPPILDLPALELATEPYFLVYLPFEDQGEVTEWLNHMPGYEFVQYAAGLEPKRQGNVQRRPASIESFKQHLFRARGVICNSGFELISECIQLNKPVLTKPVTGQFEQLSNALALEEAHMATVCHTLDTSTLEAWLESPPEGRPLHYPDVPAALAAWLAAGEFRQTTTLGRLWPQAAYELLPLQRKLPAATQAG